MTLLRSTAAIVLALGVTFAMPALAQKKYDTGASDTEIKVGQTIPLSGPASAYGSIGKVQAAYIRMVNEQGGINGRKINLIQYDDAYSPPKTVEQVRKLVESDEVFTTFQIIGTPPNAAVQKYLNDKKVPQLLASTGATRFTDPKNFPWTIAFNPNYQSEAHIYAKFILANHPNAKIGILYQNDDLGKDYVKGLKDGLGAKASNMIVAEASYELSDPTVDSQMVTLKASGADLFYNITTPKFGAQAIKKAAELGWKPVQILDINATPVSQTLVPAGLENAKGIISVNYGKDPLDPQWSDDEGMKRYKAFMAKYAPAEDANSGIATYGYSTAALLVQILKQCGDNLTRVNVMTQATNIKDFVADLALPGMATSTTPDDWRINKQFQMMRFDGRGLRQSHHAVFGRHVVRGCRQTNQSGDRGCVDDGSAALSQHLRNLVLQAQEYAREIDSQHGVERGLTEFVQALASRANGSSGNAGIVERAVDPPIGGDGARHHRGHIGFHGYVAPDRNGLTAGRVDQGDGCSRVLLGTVGHRHARALACHRKRSRPSDARGPAGHQRHLAIENACHVIFLLPCKNGPQRTLRLRKEDRCEFQRVAPLPLDQG